MDLRERLDDYVVTTVPERLVALSLVWSEAVVDVRDDVVPTAGDAGDGIFAVLEDYRITRVPSRKVS